MDEHERHIAFEGCHNMRDLGGYLSGDGRAVRWRRLFRSESPFNMTAADLDRARYELGIVSVIDLRSAERAAARRTALSSPPVRYYNLPIASETQEQEFVRRGQVPNAEALIDLLTDAGAAIRELFEILRDEPSYPVLVHCAAGKDRTGIAAALILSVLGVQDHDIVADYAMTGANMDRLLAGWPNADLLPTDGSFPAGLSRTFFDTPPEVMRSFLDALRREHGSIGGYVASVGVDSVMCEALERTLLSA